MGRKRGEGRGEKEKTREATAANKRGRAYKGKKGWGKATIKAQRKDEQETL